MNVLKFANICWPIPRTVSTSNNPKYWEASSFRRNFTCLSLFWYSHTSQISTSMVHPFPYCFLTHNGLYDTIQYECPTSHPYFFLELLHFIYSWWWLTHWIKQCFQLLWLFYLQSESTATLCIVYQNMKPTLHKHWKTKSWVEQIANFSNSS